MAGAASAGDQPAMREDKVFTLNDARRLRDVMAANIEALVTEYQRRVTSVEVLSIVVAKNETKDRRGVRSSAVKCTIGVRLREGSGPGSDL